MEDVDVRGTAPLAPVSANPDAVRKQVLDVLTSHRAGQPPEGERYLERISRRLEQADMALPRFPEVAVELDRLICLDEPPQRELLATVQRDPQLVHEIWVTASSSPYRDRPTTLDEGIARVGLNRLWHLGVKRALASAVFLCPGFDREVAQVRTRGHVAAELAAWLGGTRRGPLYLGGLLHDVGVLVLLADVLGTKGPRDRAPRALVASLVEDLHAPVGLLAAHAWGMDEVTATSVGFHHAPERSPEHPHAAAFVGIAAVTAEAATEPDRSVAARRWLRPWLQREEEVERVMSWGGRLAARATT